MEGSFEARGSVNKKVKGSKEEKGGGFIEEGVGIFKHATTEGRTAWARPLVGHKGTGL